MHRVLARLDDEPPSGGEENVTKLFEWAFNYSVELAKIVISFGASLVASFVLAYFKKDELTLHLRAAPFAFVGAVLVMVAGLIYYWRVRRARSEYVAGLRLYAQLKVTVPYLKRHFPSLYKLLV